MSQKLGQHFLADGSVAGRIVRAARVEASDTIVEIGPGRGALTNLFVQARPRALTLVEVDAGLVSLLRERYHDKRWVTVVEADARSVEPSGLGNAGGYKLAGNLPYYAASPIIRNFLESGCAPSVLVVMLQREVALEMAAEPGEMGLLSVGVQVYASVEVLFDVPPSAFRPPPKVYSSVVRLTPSRGLRVRVDSPEDFFKVVRAGFRAPRKQLRNSLSSGLGVTVQDAADLLDAAGLDASRRPATLALEEWAELYRAWSLMGRAVEQAGA